MNITTQAIVNAKVKHTSSIPFRSIPSSSNRMRLNVKRDFFNKKPKPFDRETFKIKNISFDMIYCKNGFFEVDVSKYEVKRPKLEEIKHPFLLGETEVTQELYEAVMGHNPSMSSFYPYTISGKHPVEQVSWFDAVMFCNKLSIKLKKRPYYRVFKTETQKGTIETVVDINTNANGFRLPTEFEWEYAAKAGTKNEWAGSNNKNDMEYYAWMRNNSNDKTHPVKKKLPNEWGFYDMSGNVSEWCYSKLNVYAYSSERFFDTDDVVFRGGNYSSSSLGTTTTYRSSYNPGTKNYKIGFRVSASIIN